MYCWELKSHASRFSDGRLFCISQYLASHQNKHIRICCYHLKGYVFSPLILKENVVCILSVSILLCLSFMSVSFMSILNLLCRLCLNVSMILSVLKHFLFRSLFSILSSSFIVEFFTTFQSLCMRIEVLI